MRTFFLLFVGLLPGWAALLFIGWCYATMPVHSAGNAWWALLPAFAACGFSMPFAAITIWIHGRTKGSPARRFRTAAGFFTIVVLSLVAYGLKVLDDRRRVEVLKKVEQAEIIELVRANPQIRALAGESIEVRIGSVRGWGGATLPLFYDVSVDGSTPVRLLVKVNRTAEPASFEFHCFTLPGTGRAPLGHPGCENYEQ